MKYNRIKEVLIEQNWSQKRLAEELDKSYNMVNAYAQNRQQPRIEVLFRIADLLNVDVRQLLEHNG